MQVHYTTKTFNYLISAACVVAIYICYQELFLKNENSSKSSLFSIGQVLETNNNVKSKSEDFLGWQNLNSDTALAANNLVFTHKDSSAKIKIDANTLSLGPETMVEITSSDSVSLNQGKMNIEFDLESKPLKVTSGDSTYTINSTDAKITLTNTESSSILSVQEGRVNLQDNKTKKTIEVLKDQTLKISPLNYQIVSSNIELIHPKDAATFQSNKPVAFEVSSKLKNLNIEIANDKDFKKTHKLSAIKDKLNLVFNSNAYYWRARSGMTKSEIRSFEIIDFLNPPRLITPRLNFEKIYYSDSTNIYFSWSKENENKWLLEIFNKDNKLVFFKEVNKPNYLYPNQLEGHFKWSVTPLKSFSKVVDQKFYTFSVKKNKIEDIKSIVLELKKPNQKVNFSWNKSNSQISVFELSQHEDFEKLILSKRLKSNKTTVVFPKVGTYFWRSFTIKASGERQYNTPIRLTVKPNPKPKKPKKLPSLKLKLQTKVIPSSFHLFSYAHASNEGSVTLKWPKIDNAKEYEVEIYTDRKLKTKIKTFKTSKTNFEWTAPRAGKFYWRYRFIDFWGRLSPYSDRSTLELVDVKKISLSKKVEIKSEKKTSHHSLTFAYLLTNFDYNNENDNEFIIDGVSTNGFELSYQFKSYKFTASTTTGEVFENEEFVHRLMEFSFCKTYKDINFESGLTTTASSVYENKSSTAINDGLIYNYFIFASANLYWQHNKLKSAVKLGYGPGYLFNLATSYYFYSNKQFKYFLKVSGELLRAKVDTQELKSSQFQASIGSSYTF
jgi:hypothetical protein